MSPGRQQDGNLYLIHKDLSKYIIFDIETDGLDASIIWCAVAMNAATKEVKRLVGHDEIRKFIEAQSHDTIWVGHNAISFDIPTCNRLLGTRIPTGRIVDTLVLSYLYHPGLPGGHSLAAWGERFRVLKGDFHDFSKFSTEMLEYCVQDIHVTHRLFNELTRRMASIGYSERSCALEHSIRHVVDKQQRNGWWFDVDRANELLGTLRSKQQAYEESVRSLFPPELVVQGTYNYRTKADGLPYASYTRHLNKFAELRFSDDKLSYEVLDWEDFNLGSPKQRLDRLVSLGFVPTKFTKTGGPSVDEDSLVEFAKSNGDARVQALADFLVVSGRGNMVQTWLNNVGSDHRIHGRVFTCGANSRRMTHNTPNTANVPSNEAKYGEECRSLWSIDPSSSRVVVGYDAKSVQMRMFAHFLPDPTTGRRYYDSDFCPDPHQENADLIGINRKPVKNVFYANLFGAYPPKLASTAGRVGNKSDLQEYGEWIQSELYRVTPGLKEATDQAQSEWKRNKGRLRCVDGGFVVCPTAHAALNYKIQPAEAVLMKTASVLIDKRCRERGIEQLKIGDIHDEGQHETDKRSAHTLGNICTDAIRDAGEELGFKVPMSGEYKVGRSWAETH